MDGLIAPAQGDAPVGTSAMEIVEEEVQAIKFLAGLARRACPAVVPGQDHMIARFDLSHPRPYLFDDASPFVSKDTGWWRYR
jgi:hypothetical protein